MHKTHRKVLALETKGDGPFVYIARADRLVVKGLQVGDKIALQCNGTCIIEIAASGTYDVKIKDKELYVRRIIGDSPISVFAESDVCH